MQSYANAGAIIFGCLLVAGAIHFGNVDVLAFFSNDASETASATEVAGGDATREENRHLYGNEDAPTTIVEFSDLECPFCARVHPVIKQIVDESNGEINWEYRHFPLPNHTTADEAAVLGECLYEQQGNDAFWTYIDEIFAGNISGVIEYTALAVKLGADEAELEACFADPEMTDRITKDMQTARAFGGSGTPHSLIVEADGTITPVRGALPYEQWQMVLP